FPGEPLGRNSTRCTCAGQNDSGSVSASPRHSAPWLVRQVPVIGCSLFLGARKPRPLSGSGLHCCEVLFVSTPYIAQSGRCYAAMVMMFTHSPHLQWCPG